MLDKEQLYHSVMAHGSIRKAADAMGISEKALRVRLGRYKAGGANTGRPLGEALRHKHHEGRIDMSVDNGSVIVFSDAHFYPGVRTTVNRALLSMIRNIKPLAVVCNGDAFDGGTISRYPRIGWDNKPTVAQELEAVESALTEIEEAAKGAALVWPMGNHDARYETYLAANAPQYEGVRGFSLKDRFPLWKPCWTLWVNENTCITHFYHTGMHAVWNNLLKAQCNYVSSHRHSPEVRAYTNAMGKTLYGVDTGSLADALADHNVDYQQGRHGNHRSAFAVLTWRDGQLLMPELCQKFNEDAVQFRGHVLHADTLEVM